MSYRVPGPCTVEWKVGGSTYTSIGGTKQGVLLRPNTGIVPILEDKGGDQPVSFIFTGKSAIVEVVGLSTTDVSAATLWPELLELGGKVGALASAAAQSLRITEADGTSIWIADKAFPVDPREFSLKSTQEIMFPMMFAIIPVSGVLFSTVPTYLL